MKKIISFLSGLVLVISCILVLRVTPAFAASAVIYNNIPNPLPGNLSSEAFEAQSASEFGGQVMFAGTARLNPTVTITLSSWGCESGHWYSGDCVTTSGATFSEPITLNIYNVNADNTPGTKIATVTQTFNIPYRPSADNTNCTGGNAGKWSDGTTCYNGFANNIVFNLSSLTLPNKAIISVAYNTTHYGYAPIGESAPCFSSSGGCGYDSLNVALNAPPTVGTDPLPDSAYLYSTWTGAYCDNGVSGTGTFRLDSGCWTGIQPAMKVEAQSPSTGFVTGGLTLSGPRQQISFNAFDYGTSSLDTGTVEYQNFEYPGGLHYTANVMCANVNKTTNEAWFMFQIPNGFSGLSGLYVVSYVKDNGSPGTKDKYGHTATADLSTALSWCENGNASVSLYTTTGGNAVVH